MSQTTKNKTEATMPRRAYSYTRVSGKIQKHGDGPRRQEEYAPELCAREGWQLDDTLILRDIGVSAYRGSNADVGDLARFLEAVTTGRVSSGSVLIIESLDRLSRDEVDEAYDLFRGLIRAGVWIATRTPERIYSKETSKNFLDLLEPLFIFLRAHEESEIKSFRARKNWARKRALAREEGAPLSSTCPAWMERVGDEYRLIDARADVVRLAYRWSQEGLGDGRIAARLQADPKRFPPWCSTGGWSRSNIYHMLTDPRVYGAGLPTTFVEVARTKSKGSRMARTREGALIAGYYPAVLGEEEWQETQRVRKGRAGHTGRPGTDEANLFTGIVFHAATGRRLQVKPTYSSGNVYHYLREQVPAASSVRIDYPSFEQLVLRKFESMQACDLDPSRPEIDERERRIGELTQRVISLADRARVIEAQLEDPTTEAAGAPVLAALLARIEGSKQDAIAEVDSLKQEARSGRAEGLAEFHGLLELLRDVEPAARPDLRRRVKARVRALVAEIWVLVDPIRKGSRLVHVQVDLRTGGRLYAQQVQSKTVGDEFQARVLSGVDLREFVGESAGLRKGSRRLAE